MNCSHCGCFVALLVSCQVEIRFDADDEVIRKTTIELYVQCHRERCRHSKTVNLEIAEEKLPFQIVLVEP